MMKFNRILGFASVLLVAACVNTQNIDDIRKLDTTGTGASQYLANEYRALALFEGDEMQDWNDANYYAEKGLRAAAGEMVGPETPANRELPESEYQQVQSAHNSLTEALNKGRTANPKTAAVAQAKFDCWLEQLEENVQPTHIARCRQEFCAAMAELLDQGTNARKWDPVYCEPRKVATPERDYTVYFALGSAQITPAGLRTIREAAEEARRRGTRVSVVGHTDRSGNNAANQTLSNNRANNVRNALVSQGVDGQLVTTTVGYGEERPAVPTADGQVEQRNRRVEIIIR